MSILQQHHIEFVEDRKRKQYWAICTCGWEKPFNALMDAHMAAAIHDLDLEEEDDNTGKEISGGDGKPVGGDDTDGPAA